jgi:hydrogenase maturation protease
MRHAKTLVLGIGNTLLSDEGAGVHAAAYLRDRLGPPPGVEILDGGTLGFTLAGPIAQAQRLVVIDAARLGAPAGTVRHFTDAEMDRYLKGARGSVHEVGLSDLMDMARLSGHLPAPRALIAIQPQTLDWGDAPSPAVAQAIQRAAALTLELIETWQRADPGPSGST